MLHLQAAWPAGLTCQHLPTATDVQLFVLIDPVTWLVSALQPCVMRQLQVIQFSTTFGMCLGLLFALQIHSEYVAICTLITVYT